MTAETCSGCGETLVFYGRPKPPILCPKCREAQQ